MSNFNDIKKRLAMSTTMPLGTGGFVVNTHHEHKHDGSCCGHDHSHEHSHDHDEDSEDNTNPSGGCC